MANAPLAKREAWVDNVKVIACIFFAFGHCLQSIRTVCMKTKSAATTATVKLQRKSLINAQPVM